MSGAGPAQTKPIHEVKDQLSRLIADIEATGRPLNITRHGRVVAVLGPAGDSAVVLGAGARPGVTAPSVRELSWASGEFDDVLDAPVEPT